VSEPPSADPVAARLRGLRATLGLSQEQLARRLGVSFATVNRWESGRTQLSPRAARALAELEASAAQGSGAARPGQLPLAHTSFVGRDRELAELARLLGEARLVSLIGPGGAGKTRLAVEAIRRSLPDADVVFLPLESVRLPGSLVPALASRLGVHDQPGLSLTESLHTALARSPRLLVLDGAESLREEAARLIGDLLDAVPGVRVVVTSRVLLGIPGEVCWTVPPLACPSVAAGAADVAASDAVQLFIARASDRLPGFQATDVAPHAVAELCRRLDGLPLAIELIASWVGTLSVREILQQRAVLLESGPGAAGRPGVRRLGDVLQASYDLLEPGLRQVLPQLSVFAGEFGLADAQAVLDVDSATAAVTLRALVDSSWLVVTRGPEQNRFSMLETIRAFARAELETSGAAPAVRARHAVHFADLAIASEPGLASPDAPAWTARLEAADQDLQLALDWAEEHNDLDLGLDAAAGLWRWWLTSGRLALGRGWLARLLAAAGRRSDERAGRALCSAAVLAAENGDYREAVRQAEQAQAIFGALGLAERTAFAATVLASAHRYLGNTAAARRSFQTAMNLRTAVGDLRGVSVAINNIALLELDDGNLEEAQHLFERALEIKRQLGEQRSVAVGLANLADVLIRRAQWQDAERVLAEGEKLATGIPQIAGTISCNLGHLAAHRHDWATASAHFEAAIAASQAAGHPHDVVEAMLGLATVEHQAGSAHEAAARLQSARTLAAGVGNLRQVEQIDATLARLTAPARASQQADGPLLPGGLTARQAEVLGLVAAGLSNKQIAAELFLSTATVERHLATIYSKLGASGRVDAARIALEAGLRTRAPERRAML
jgi:predicted ATPase/DNA-binding CsgD family transcriptional regulator/DNA-binding XRE family transcriptional regulator